MPSRVCAFLLLRAAAALRPGNPPRPRAATARRAEAAPAPAPPLGGGDGVPLGPPAAASEPGDSRIEDITGTLEAHLGRLSADVLGTLKKMLTNIVDNPAVEKYRFIKRGGSHRGVRAVVAHALGVPSGRWTRAAAALGRWRWLLRGGLGGTAACGDHGGGGGGSGWLW